MLGQLRFYGRCVFDAYALRTHNDVHDALKALIAFTVEWQRVSDKPASPFGRRPTTYPAVSIRR